MKALPRDTSTFTPTDRLTLIASDAQAPASDSQITLNQQLAICREHLEPLVRPLPEPYASCVMFFSVSAPGLDASVFFVRRATFKAAWREGATRVRQWAWARKLESADLRIEWACSISALFAGRNLDIADAAVSWALADDDLEHAVLAWPQAVSRPAESGAPPESFSQVLSLHGVHIDHVGQTMKLPRTDWCGQQPVLMPLPLQAVWLQLAEQNNAGSWPGTGYREHMWLSYTLMQMQTRMQMQMQMHMQTQMHDRASALRSTHIAEAIERSLAYLLEFEGAHRLDDLVLRLLIIRHYQANRQATALNPRVRTQLDKLLGRIRDAISAAGSSEGIGSLSHQLALVLTQEQPATASANAPLIEHFLALPHAPDQCEPEESNLLAIFILEHLDAAERPPHWADLAHQRLESIVRRMVTPERAMLLSAAQRDKAAFVRTTLTTQWLTDVSESAHLLLTVLALQRFFVTTCHSERGSQNFTLEPP